ncbi:MAG: class I SAM-dependent methyltransferase [Nanoarchaeota archaeon]
MNKERFYRSLEGFSETKDGKLKRNVPKERWDIAHISEEEFWNDFTADSLLKKTFERYEKKAEILLKEWAKYIKISKNIRILQIGCGPEDVINHFKKGKKYSIDPLADFYKKKFKFDYKSTHLIKAQGEAIPFPDKHFDIVILINVLDHTHLPEKVLNEINRVLKDKGIFHFENYVFQKRFVNIAKIWSILKKTFSKKIFNIHHPYMFTKNDLKVLVSDKFSILHEEIGRDIGNYENFEELEKAVINSKNPKLFIPGIFGLLGTFNYTIICKKISSNK